MIPLFHILQTILISGHFTNMLSNHFLPSNHFNKQDTLRRIISEHPIFSALDLAVRVVLVAFERETSEGSDHGFFDAFKPVLDFVAFADDDVLVEDDFFGHVFGLGGDHGSDFAGVFIFCELDAVDVVETLTEMRLDRVGVPGLGKDLEEVVVGEEVEPGEGKTFGLQIVF
jgi:hypothetical protein